LALLYGSVAKGTDTAASDVDILIVAEGLTLEDVYAALAPAEAVLERSINPTLYTSQEFADRRSSPRANGVES
jgi:predicted nucleotidyltransferase